MHGEMNHVTSSSIVDMASIPEEDVFIPEACGVCSPGDKRSYNEWIDKTLIPQLKHQNIRFGDRSKASFLL